MHLLARSERKARFAAFTLVEALIGVAVMGTVFVSLYAGMATGFQSIRTSQENLRATQIMTEKFEAMRLFNWDQLNAPGFVPSTFTARYAPGSSAPGISYTGTIRIEPVLGQPYRTDLKAVTITLSWRTGSRLQTRTLTSYVARYGLQTYLN